MYLANSLEDDKNMCFFPSLLHVALCLFYSFESIVNQVSPIQINYLFLKRDLKYMYCGPWVSLSAFM